MQSSKVVNANYSYDSDYSSIKEGNKFIEDKISSNDVTKEINSSASVFSSQDIMDIQPIYKRNLRIFMENLAPLNSRINGKRIFSSANFKLDEKTIDKPVMFKNWLLTNYPKLNKNVVSQFLIIENIISDGNSCFRAIIIEWLTIEISEKGIFLKEIKFINDLFENKPILISCSSKIKLLKEEYFKNTESTRIILMDFFTQIIRKIKKKKNCAHIRESIIKKINKENMLDISLIIFVRSILGYPCLFSESIDFDKVNKIMGLEFSVISINKQENKAKISFSTGINPNFILISNYNSSHYDILNEEKDLSELNDEQYQFLTDN